MEKIPWLKTDWLKRFWNSQIQYFRRFQKEHSQSGVYTDNWGLILLTTINFLKVNINIVSKESTGQHMTSYKYEGSDGPRAEFYLGY